MIDLKDTGIKGDWVSKPDPNSFGKMCIENGWKMEWFTLIRVSDNVYRWVLKTKEAK